MEFDFLFDPTRKLFSIGFRVTDGRLDPGGYDLLASEARLASFIAIAKGDVPSSHWFQLSRPLTPVGTGAALLSWSGSMFEYLMPALVMRSTRQPAGSDLSPGRATPDERMARSGDSLGHLRIGFQRARSGTDLSVLEFRRARPRAQTRPQRRHRHCPLCDRAGRDGRPARRCATLPGSPRWARADRMDSTRRSTTRDRGSPRGDGGVVRAYMAHHQGMSIVALANVLRDGAMRERFHAEPIIQATELLLQERTPRDVAVARPRAEEVRRPPMCAISCRRCCATSRLRTI